MEPVVGPQPRGPSRGDPVWLHRPPGCSWVSILPSAKQGPDGARVREGGDAFVPTGGPARGECHEQAHTYARVFHACSRCTCQGPCCLARHFILSRLERSGRDPRPPESGEEAAEPHPFPFLLLPTSQWLQANVSGWSRDAAHDQARSPCGVSRISRNVLFFADIFMFREPLVTTHECVRLRRIILQPRCPVLCKRVCFLWFRHKSL